MCQRCEAYGRILEIPEISEGLQRIIKSKRIDVEALRRDLGISSGILFHDGENGNPNNHISGAIASLIEELANDGFDFGKDPDLFVNAVAKIYGGLKDNQPENK